VTCAFEAHTITPFYCPYRKLRDFRIRAIPTGDGSGLFQAMRNGVAVNFAGMADAGSFVPKPSTAVRAQLDRILESESFAQSERLKSLLRCMVEQSLASRSIKQMDLALDVLGRDESFDPGVDPLVRVQVGGSARDWSNTMPSKEDTTPSGFPCNGAGTLLCSHSVAMTTSSGLLRLLIPINPRLSSSRLRGRQANAKMTLIHPRPEWEWYEGAFPCILPFIHLFRFRSGLPAFGDV
jgi:hypothetical protein